MYDEFVRMSGQEISYKQYDEIIEPMYIAVDNMTKEEFIKFILPKTTKKEKEKIKMRKTINVKDILSMAFVYEGEEKHDAAVAIMNTVTYLADSKKGGTEKFAICLDLLDDYKVKNENAIMRESSVLWAEKCLSLIA